MLGVVAAADAAPVVGDALLVDALARDGAIPPLGVARAGAEVDGLVARDADLALVRHHDEEREYGDAETDEALLRHLRASAMKQMRRCPVVALAMNVTSAGPGVVGAASLIQPSSTPGFAWATCLPPTSIANEPGARMSRRVNTSASPTYATSCEPSCSCGNVMRTG